ncbi:MAG: hypothetical protein K2L80_06795, partial [Muribaculaceae bacterium]|nr:hypothetical protein [Muribaculaceae bacterium]
MKIRLLLLCLVCFTVAGAQIPYYAPATGHGNLNGYTSLKFRPGVEAKETYTSFLFGIGDYAATGLDLQTDGSKVYGGIIARGGYVFSRYFGVGAQLTPSFEINGNMKFAYLTSGLFFNGDICRDSRLFWAANTWYTASRHAADEIDQYLYLGSTIPLPHGQSITPMAGT